MSNRFRADAGSRTEPDIKDRQLELTDEQWSLIADLFSHRPPGPRGNARASLEGIL